MDTSGIVKANKDIGIDLQERGWGRAKDYQGGKSVVVQWSTVSREDKDKGLFLLHVGRETVLLSKHELQYLLRNV